MNRKKIKILLLVIAVLAIILVAEYMSTGNDVLLDKVIDINAEDLNAMTDDGVVDYRASRYINSKDTLYIVDSDGNEYKLINASKRQLGENLTDIYYKQYFKDMKPSNVMTTITNIDYSSVLSTVFMLGFYSVMLFILIKYMGGINSAPKAPNQESNKISTVKFEDVKGHTEAKRDIQFIIDFLKNPQKYKKMNVRFPKGILLNGPPGTGKTLIAKAIAGETGVPIYNVTGSDFNEMFVGLGAKRVRDLFKEARKNAPSIIFIDEIDSVAQKRTGGQFTREHDQTLNALLSCMDGFDDDETVLIIAATNRKDVLDPAILRPGRFDRHIELGYPDTLDRVELCKLYLDGKPLDEDVTPEYIASQTFRFSGAMIDSLINESALIAALNGKEKITREDISHAILKVITGGDRKDSSDKVNTKKELIAIHEAGHALAYRKLCNMPVPKVSIVPTTTGALGWTLTSPEDSDMELISMSDMENQVICLYAGRASELIYYEGDASQVTTGASNDIKQATKLIYSMVTELGFDNSIGNINLSVIQEQTRTINSSEIVKKVSDKSDHLYEKSLEFIKDNYATIKDIANILLEKETIDQMELDTIIENNA